MVRFGAVVALAALAESVLQAVFGGLLLTGLPPPPGNSTVFFLMANVLSAAVVVVLASRIAWRGWRRALTLFLVSFGIQANNLLEAVFFSLDIPRVALPLLVLDTLCVSALFSLVVDRLVPAAVLEGHGEPPPRTAMSWAARIAACDVAYVIAYFAAGLIVLPHVQGFYSGRPMPTAQAVLSMAMFRGLVFTGIVGLLVRHLGAGRMGAAILAGATLSVLGGIVPLMVPNPYMPDAIRLPHMVEVGVSNFAWGVVAALLLLERARGPAGSTAAAA
jgi:hypothetical protein